MQKEKQPTVNKVKVSCTTCNNEFETTSVLKEIKVDVCSACHPVYTGKQTSGSKAGRIERFNRKLTK